jgi:hypothetical protein
MAFAVTRIAETAISLRRTVMFKKLTLAALACTLGALAVAAPASAGVDKRQARQQHRISQGVANGSLTTREANRLGHQQDRIARYEAASRADGKGLSRRERANIARMQRRANRNVHHQKHDSQHR